jgi:hypothetical protein
MERNERDKNLHDDKAYLEDFNIRTDQKDAINPSNLSIT